MDTLIGWKDITYSPEAEKALQELKEGKTMAVRMKHVANGKVQIEFAQKFNSPNPVKSALGLLNKSDDRFNFSSGARRAWETGQPEDIKALFGFEIPEGKDSVEILKTLPEVNGNEFSLQIIEVTESQYRERNSARTNPDAEEYIINKLKRAGSDGHFFYTETGERVISEPMLVVAPKGVAIENTYLKGSFKSSEQASKPADVKTMIGSTRAVM